jgi:hypothetical protein
MRKNENERKEEIRKGRKKERRSIRFILGLLNTVTCRGLRVTKITGSR